MDKENAQGQAKAPGNYLIFNHTAHAVLQYFYVPIQISKNKERKVENIMPYIIKFTLEDFYT